MARAVVMLFVVEILRPQNERELVELMRLRDGYRGPRRRLQAWATYLLSDCGALPKITPAHAPMVRETSPIIDILWKCAYVASVSGGNYSEVKAESDTFSPIDSHRADIQ